MSIKSIFAISLSVICVTAALSLTVSANPIPTSSEQQIVYQDDEYTVVATPMTKEEATALFEYNKATRGGDAINNSEIPDGDDGSFAPRSLKTYVKSKDYSFSSFKNPIVKITCTATVDTVSSVNIGTLRSARLAAGSFSACKNTITFVDYDYAYLDGKRTIAINYAYDIEQDTKDMWGNWGDTRYSGSAIYFEIYATGGANIY